MAGLRVGRPVGVLHPWGEGGYSPLAQVKGTQPPLVTRALTETCTPPSHSNF